MLIPVLSLEKPVFFIEIVDYGYYGDAFSCGFHFGVGKGGDTGVRHIISASEFFGLGEKGWKVSCFGRKGFLLKSLGFLEIIGSMCFRECGQTYRFCRLERGWGESCIDL